ncbi:transposase [Streptomyces sp. NPDC006335]|uniref:transposase n=1 Tax=Streptomyces sp. NPDC006335 TaxID=3156895 RepID=UPI0033ADBD23
MSVRSVITDAMWGRIEPLPANPVRGRWADHRRTSDAIAWKYRTCSPWRDLPDELGSFQTAHKRPRRHRRPPQWRLPGQTPSARPRRTDWSPPRVGGRRSSTPGARLACRTAWKRTLGFRCCRFPLSGFGLSSPSGHGPDYSGQGRPQPGDQVPG